MAKQANRKYCDIEVCEGDLAQLSTKHLRLPASLFHKFAPRFIGPFRVIEAVTAVSFCFDLPTGQCIYPVFHISQLNTAVSNGADLPSNLIYSPPPDALGEFEV